ncbi:MAG: type III pantothenate kinase [Dehalococcoidia bacterium]|nr:type III pantothenate kinase [Dehalococcoidia bacterium]
MDQSGLLLAIDIGNTSIAIGVYDGAQRQATFRIATDQDNLSDEYAMLVLGLLRANNIEPKRVTAAVLSSTVPSLIQTFEAVCRRYFGVSPVVIGTGVKTGVRVRYDNPREVGPDRILHAVAALAKYKPPLIIVDLGTALVFDAVSREGDYLGGAIAPGIGIASAALFARAAMLHRISIQRPTIEGAIGRNTVHSMQSGIFFGYAEMVAGMVRRFKSDVGEDATVIATGGYAEGIAQESGVIDHIEPDLNLDGLRLVHELNSEPSKEARS